MKRTTTKIAGALVAGKICGLLGELAYGSSWASGFAAGFLTCILTTLIVVKAIQIAHRRKQAEAGA